MIWYDHLYLGEKAKKNRYRILQGLRKGNLQPEVYVIVPPQNGNNVLEILPSFMLWAPAYQEMEIFVIGVAVTYWEGLEVARQIVDELYQKTGGFCLEELIGGREADDSQ
jgi:hypothetical protein